MKLLFLTGSRGEWGYIRPILNLIKNRSDVSYSICATNMHLLPANGMSIEKSRQMGLRLKMLFIWRLMDTIILR